MAKVILTVDDSTSVRQLVNFTLAQGGYTGVEAIDGQDALMRLSPQVNLVITDLNMPNLDGIGFIRKVRSNGTFKGLPIVMLTTESQAERKQEGRAAGATAWIVKRPVRSCDWRRANLRLGGPVALGDRIVGWRVCWLVGWDRSKVFFVVIPQLRAPAAGSSPDGALPRRRPPVAEQPLPRFRLPARDESPAQFG